MNQRQCCEQLQQQAFSDMQDTTAGQKVAITLPLQASVHISYEDRQSMVAGIILIIVGFLSVIITAVGLGVYNIFTFIAHGIWFGIVVSKPWCLSSQAWGSDISQTCSSFSAEAVMLTKTQRSRQRPQPSRPRPMPHVFL